MQCASCDFWKPWQEPVIAGSGGECHRYAPRSILCGGTDANWTSPKFDWPETTAADWCGDYQRHPSRRLQE